MVWAIHCLIGTPGHAVQADLMAALNRWAEANFANINFVTKGTNPWTEHYGALQAEVPMPSDPSTGLNTRLLEMLETADMVVVARSLTQPGQPEPGRRQHDERLTARSTAQDCTSASLPSLAAAGAPAMERCGGEMVARGRPHNQPSSA